MSDRFPESPPAAELLEVDPLLVGRRVTFYRACADLYRGDRAAAGEDPATGDGPSWSVAAQRATMLRLAGQFQLLLDHERARSLLLEAALTYAAVGVPYGYFLFTAFMAASPPPSFRIAPEPWLGPLRGGTSRRPPSAGPGRPGRARTTLMPAGPLLESAASHPVQQAYLQLALAGDLPAERDDLGADLRRLQSLSPAAAASPVGPQRTPLAAYWEVADLLAALRASPTAVAQRAQLETLLAEHARRFEVAIRAARADAYHWRAGRPQTDVVDLDLAGQAALADGVLSTQDGQGLAPFQGALTQLSRLARLPVELGIALKRRSPGPGDQGGLGAPLLWGPQPPSGFPTAVERPDPEAGSGWPPPEPAGGR